MNSIDIVPGRVYNPVMNKNTEPIDWTHRANVTLPADMADYIRGVADKLDLPVYRLVFDAVQAYAAYRGAVIGSQRGHGADT